jgi:hypothetical protein
MIMINSRAPLGSSRKAKRQSDVEGTKAYRHYDSAVGVLSRLPFIQYASKLKRAPFFSDTEVAIQRPHRIFSVKDVARLAARNIFGVV